MEVCFKNYNYVINPLKSNNFNGKVLNSARFTKAMPTVSQGFLPSFGIRKDNLSGFELICAQQLKPLIEKFITKNDFLSWIKQKLVEKTDLNLYINEKDIVQKDVRHILSEWKNYLLKDDRYKNDPPLSLIIFNSITRGLAPNNRFYPPILCEDVLTETVEQLNKVLVGNPNAKFDFNKLYQNNLLLKYSKNVFDSAKDSEGHEIGRWVRISSKENDPQEFSENVKKLQALSYKNWCTRVAEESQYYLDRGDFYIYLEDNKPRVGIRFDDNEILQIEGRKNNKQIPLEYIDIIKSFVFKNGFSGLEKEIRKRDNAAKEIKVIHEKFADDFKNKEYKNILNYFGFNVKVDENGMFEISHFQQPNDFTFEELGINENELFKKISRISRNAYFEESKVTDLGSLQIIGNDAFFDEKIGKIFGNLVNISGDIWSGGHLINKNEVQFLQPN